jgi:hypothetical protein
VVGFSLQFCRKTAAKLIAPPFTKIGRWVERAWSGGRELVPLENAGGSPVPKIKILACGKCRRHLACGAPAALVPTSSTTALEARRALVGRVPPRGGVRAVCARS